MRRTGLIAICLSAVACGVAAADEPREVLKERDLKVVGENAVLSGESQVNKLLGEAPKLRKQLVDAIKKRTAAERNIAEKDALIERLIQQRRTLNAQLPNVTSVQQNNRLVAALNEISDQITLLSGAETLEEAATQARNTANQARENYVDHILALRRSYDNVLQDYESLTDDAAVTDAIAQLSATKPVKLGPSRSFTSNDAKIKKLEETVLSEKITLRQTGGVYLTSVVVNGAKAQEFVVDTGAGLVTIPSSLADDMKLTPTPQSPTLRLSVADGRVIEAKLVIARTIRVGRFTAENVECAVLPETAVNAEPLLGQSFLSKFSYQIDSAAGELVMTQVDGEDGTPPGRRPAANRGPAAPPGKPDLADDE
ncbi:MAG: retroviral-like aspartic protease family protein [Planctomyces sp.]|nr:retroviral-like aspartic protease family protein [Planctomyces sp.]